MSPQITVKQGASLNLLLQVWNDDGTAADISTVALTANVRNSQGQLVAVLPITQPGQTGAAAISVYDTSSWPLGILRLDVRLQGASSVLISDTLAIVVGRSVTQP